MKKIVSKLRFFILILFIISICAVLYMHHKYSTTKLYSDMDKPIINVYHYMSTDFGFESIEVPEKGRSLEVVEKYFKDYVVANNLTDVELRITTKPNKWDNLNHRRWKYKYMEPPKEK